MRRNTETTTAKKISPKRQAERKASLVPNGKPKMVRCYDNGGPEKDNGSIDRYTVVFTGNYTHKTGRAFWYLAMSGSPFHPQGFGQYGETMYKPCDKPTYSHLGKKIKFEDLNEDCQQYVMQTYLYLWDFTDEDGNEI